MKPQCESCRKQTVNLFVTVKGKTLIVCKECRDRKFCLKNIRGHEVKKHPPRRRN